MINAYTITAQTVPTNGTYVFNTNRILTGCTVEHTAGTDVFTLKKPGYYYVTFNTTFTTSETGLATVQLQNGGIDVPGASGAETVTTAGDTKSLSFATLIRVLPSCCAVDNTANLTFVATGIELNATVANVNITKLC